MAGDSSIKMVGCDRALVVRSCGGIVIGLQWYIEYGFDIVQLSLWKYRVGDAVVEVCGGAVVDSGGK